MPAIIMLPAMVLMFQFTAAQAVITLETTAVKQRLMPAMVMTIFTTGLVIMLLVMVAADILKISIATVIQYK